MDLSTMRIKAERNKYHSLEALHNDVILMTSNYLSRVWQPEKREVMFSSCTISEETMIYRIHLCAT